MNPELLQKLQAMLAQFRAGAVGPTDKYTAPFAQFGQDFGQSLQDEGKRVGKMPMLRSGDAASRAQWAKDNAAWSKRAIEGYTNMAAMTAGPDGRVSLHAPNEDIGMVARDYLANHKIDTKALPKITAVDKVKAKHMADVYESLKSDPNNPEVQAAYEQFGREVKQQHAALVKAGYKFDFSPHDPYPNSAAMLADLRDKKMIKVFKTAEGQEHPLMSNEENDLFRAIHDAFGHGISGNQFGPKGEEGAFRDHSAMFSPLARRVMATETRGQNSWTNFGPQSHLPVTERPYAQQKAALWPEHLMGDYSEMPAPPPADKLRSTATPQEQNEFRDLAGKWKTAWDQFTQGHQALKAEPDIRRKELADALRNPVMDSVVTKVARTVSPELPSAGGERITGIVYKAPDGTIFSGTHHFDAYQKAVAAGKFPRGAKAQEEAANGFSTTHRPFVSRDEAYNIADGADQITPRARELPWTGNGESDTPTLAAEDLKDLPSPPPADKLRNPVMDSVVTRGAKAAENAWRLPPQFDIQRPAGQAEKVAAVEELAEKVYKGKKFSKLVEQGAGTGRWYDAWLRIKPRAIDVLGEEEGTKKFNSLLDHTAASTARSDPWNNLRRGTWWQVLNERGMLDPAVLRTHAIQAPEGFGHYANKAHNSAIADLVESGKLNILQNPKPGGFKENLAGNWRPMTNDTQMATATLEAEPKMSIGIAPQINKETGTLIGTPRIWAYAPMERAFQRAAEFHQGRGAIDKLPDGMDPTAAGQSQVWHAFKHVSPENYRSFADVFDELMKKSAHLWGVSPVKANEIFWKGQPLELPLGADLMTGPPKLREKSSVPWKLRKK